MMDSLLSASQKLPTGAFFGNEFSISDRVVGIAYANVLLDCGGIVLLFSFDASNGKSDSRGDVWSEGTKCGYTFMAATSPNSTIPDQLDGSNGCPNPNAKLPCVQANGNTREFNAARSYHSGGVNVLFCDGSVKFVKDSISIPTFRALSTKDGGEVISADAY